MINSKKTILALVLCTFLYHSKAISPPLRSDSIINCTSSSDSIDRQALDTEELLQLKKGNVANKRAGWFSDFFDALTSPFRPVWGYYEESGQRTTGPYTVFQQHQGFQIDRLRTKIQNTNDVYFKFYSHIYENALTGNSQNPDSL